jgi:hypothetical protein
MAWHLIRIFRYSSLPKSNFPLPPLAIRADLPCDVRLQIVKTVAHRTGEGWEVLMIQLTRGESWREPCEIVDSRECSTDSIDAAAGEARAWLVQTQQHTPERGVTRYRVIGPDDLLIGGPER